ncbi:hypothetical protein HYT91_01770 [Candidatus Pacearchaeota archaeon]|nr:hypothetical protein [Candidatus Pacearchaeota archaeon]
MKKVEIGIYKNFKEYFAKGISGYKMKEVKNTDKYSLGIQIRNELNKNVSRSTPRRGTSKIKKGFVSQLKNGEGYYPLTAFELEAIADTISDENLEFKVKNKNE